MMAQTMMKMKTDKKEFCPYAVKKDFPALSEQVNGKNVVFLDSAASAQKPDYVIDAMANVLKKHYANVHRGVYQFSQKTTELFEQSRVTVGHFLNAPSHENIVFTRNATESINLVASSWGQILQKGDEIILTELEHHANIVPWHFLKEQKGIELKIIPLTDSNELDMDAYAKLLSPKTKMVAVTHMSNALGCITDVKKITSMAKKIGATVLIDGSQAIVHGAVDVVDIGCDFYVFTGHKLYGPTGIGVLYGTEDAFADMPPYQGGGEMIDYVSFDKVTYKEAPYRFEAGTPAIVEAIGLAAAIDYVTQFDAEDIQKHEAELLSYAEQEMLKIDGVEIYSVKAKNHASVISFTMKNIHPHDVGTILDQMGVAVRAGHHCAQPLMRALNVTATIRASIAMYNTKEDIDNLVLAVKKAQLLLG